MPKTSSVQSEEDLETLLKKSRETSWKNFGKKIRFYSPSFSNKRSNHDAFPSISVTGNSCSLKCLHCQGIVLKTMISAPTPAKLIEVCRDIKSKGGVGCLISGGCTPTGVVPLERFVDALTQIKKDLGLTLVVHTGIIDRLTAEKLKAAEIDAALIDVIGSDETIQEIYHVKSSVAAFEVSLKAISDARIPLIPHVLIGLHFGQLKGEARALQIISKYDPAAVIAISFFPIKGTAMEKIAPPKPGDIARVLVMARSLMPSTPLVLGCMRPSGQHRIETDILAIKAGVNAIAFPCDEAVALAEEMKLKIAFSPECCSLIYRDMLARRK